MEFLSFLSLFPLLVGTKALNEYVFSWERQLGSGGFLPEGWIVRWI